LLGDGFPRHLLLISSYFELLKMGMPPDLQVLEEALTVKHLSNRD